MNQHCFFGYTVSTETLVADLERILADFFRQKDAKGITFVHGIGKRKTQLQKWIEKLTDYKTRQQNYQISHELFETRNSYSKTDPDATFMRMKEDHMRNGQLKPAYNVQIGVESEYITVVGVFQERNDLTTLIPMLENLEKNIGCRYINVIADSGYESEKNYGYFTDNKYIPFIKPQTYEKWKKKTFKKDISKRENMIYHAETDEYTCHNNKQFRPIGITHRTSVTVYRSDVTIYECESCEACPVKTKCTRAKGNRRLQVSKNFIEKKQVSFENIITETGKHLRMNRSIQVEGAFGVLKNDYAFSRFLTRGKNQVKTELFLLCFGYNINKFHVKIQTQRCGYHLYPLKTTALSTLTAAEDQMDKLLAGEATEAVAETVSGQIAGLSSGDKLALGSKADVVAVRAAYNALTDIQKSLITNLDTLIAAEAKLAELEKATPPVKDEATGIEAVGLLEGVGLKVEPETNDTDKTEAAKKVAKESDIKDAEIVSLYSIKSDMSDDDLAKFNNDPDGFVTLTLPVGDDQ